MMKTRIDIDSIPAGSWESKNVVCPPAGIKTVAQILTDVNQEQNHDLAGNCIRNRATYAQKKKDKNMKRGSKSGHSK